MKTLKATLGIALTLVMTLSLIACGGTDNDVSTQEPASPGTSETAPPTTTTQAPAQQTPANIEAEAPAEGSNLADHIDIICTGSVAVINPTIPAGAGADTARIQDLLHDRLLEIRGPGDYRPGLAYEWETDDFQTIRFYLRDDVYFHNGDHFTADDVVFTLETARENQTGTAFTRWRVVETINVVEPYIIDVVLHTANYEYEFEFSHFATAIFSQRAFNENPEDPMWTSVGTGPYRVVDFSSNDFIKLERNDDYWGEMPPTRSLTFWTIPEMTARRVMLSNGEAQMAFQLSPEDADAMLENPDFNLIEDTGNIIVLAFNSQGDDVMTCPYFRLAVAHALNLEEVALVANGNWAMAPPDGNMWGMVTPYRRSDLPAREYDLTLARGYLEQSVYNGGKIELSTEGAANVRAAEMIQLQLGAIGIDIDVDVLDTASLSDKIQYNPDSTRQMWVYAIGVGPSAIATAVGQWYPGSGTNRFNVNDDDLTGMIDQLSVEGDPAAAQELAYKIQKWLWDEIPGIPAYYIKAGIPVVQGVGGLHLWGDGHRYSLRGIYWDLNQTPAHLQP